jgi:hypothetical protein
MTIAYWITAALLAVVYLMSGGMKLIQAKEALVASGQNWAKNVNPALPKLVGLLEVLGARSRIEEPGRIDLSRKMAHLRQMRWRN